MFKPQHSAKVKSPDWVKNAATGDFEKAPVKKHWWQPIVREGRAAQTRDGRRYEIAKDGSWQRLN